MSLLIIFSLIILFSSQQTFVVLRSSEQRTPHYTINCYRCVTGCVCDISVLDTLILM